MSPPLTYIGLSGSSAGSRSGPIELVRAGEIVGGIHPYIGQEAVAAGVCAALGADDIVTGTHRGHGHVLAKGADPARMLAELCGRVDRAEPRPRRLDARRRLRRRASSARTRSSAPAGSIATGAAWARRRLGGDTRRR